MSEEILKTLMQLFALVSSPSQNEEGRRKVVENYLAQQLSSTRTGDYLAMYDAYMQQQETRLRETTHLKKRYAASSVKILRIATTINEELNHYQKLIVLIQLLEFLSSGETGMSDLETEFVDSIAATFNVAEKEYRQIKGFLTDSFALPPEAPNSNLLVVTDSKKHYRQEGYLYQEHLQNELRILNIHSGNLMLVRSKKAGNLTINGQIVQPGKVYIMRPGSSLRLHGSSPLTYTSIASRFYKKQEEEALAFEVENMTFKYPNSEGGLQPLSFCSTSGSLVGIMGDSGAGKTTLINLLTGVLKPHSGRVSINGTDIHEEAWRTKGLIGYVSQDDLLMEDLTVYQNLYYNATLCFDHISKPNIKRKVLSLLKTLGLYEIRNRKVGNPLNKKLSGGQRKRLNIALELIREPAVIFMDEPTSGLSSRDSENIMDLLKEQALKGKLIFVVIHQPSSDIFKMFDQLLVLDSGGYMIYNGEAVEAINHFKDCINHINKEESECPVCGNVNPEQILTIINNNVLDEYGNPTGERKVSAAEWYQLFRKRGGDNKKAAVAKATKLPEVNFKIPGRLKQTLIFMQRDLMAKLSNRQYLVINLLESPLLALILASLVLYFDGGTNSKGYIFSQNLNLTIYLFIAVIIAIFIGLSVSAEEIINDRKILKREAFLSLSRLSYLSSKFLILSIISAIQTGLFVLVGNSIMQIKDMGTAYWLVLFSASVFANLLGLNISDSFKKTVNIYILIPFLIIPQLILSGVFVNYDQLNPRLSSQRSIPWYGELITARWAFEALAVKQFNENRYQKEFLAFEQLKSRATYHKDYWVPEMTTLLGRWEKCNETEEKAQLEKLLNNELKTHLQGLEKEAVDLSELQLPYDPPATASPEVLLEHLKQVRSFYIRVFNRADEALEAHKQKLIKENGRDYLRYLREHYHNDNLERFVRRTDNFSLQRIVVLEEEIVQKFDPIYMSPTHPFIRAHFLSPAKRIGNTAYSTYAVNVAVIWGFNALLFALLYSKVFQRLFLMGGRIKRHLVARWTKSSTPSAHRKM